jgi:hypothetical protein
MSALQDIVDSLAARLGRPVLVEDHRNCVVAYSEHHDPVDEVRRMSILRRQTATEVVTWLRGQGMHAAREPVRVPACARLGMQSRVCVPIRLDGKLLGFLLFIDADESMTQDEIALAASAAKSLAVELLRERIAMETGGRRERAAVRDLLRIDPGVRVAAARTLVEEGLITQPAGVVALVARPVHASVVPGERVRDALAQALAATRRWLVPRSAVQLARRDHGLLLATTPAHPSRRPSVEECAIHLAAELNESMRSVPGVERTVVGVGQARLRLAEAKDSYDEAVRACRMGVRMPHLDQVVHWSRLGIYGALARLPVDYLEGTSAHPGLERLFTDRAKLPLLETLEAYLDLAGNAHACARALHVHRATLYYRLQRIEELAATNLKDGSERLCLHLALKLGRLTGRYVPRSPAQAVRLRPRETVAGA